MPWADLGGYELGLRGGQVLTQLSIGWQIIIVLYKKPEFYDNGDKNDDTFLLSLFDFCVEES